MPLLGRFSTRQAMVLIAGLSTINAIRLPTESHVLASPSAQGSVSTINQVAPEQTSKTKRAYVPTEQYAARTVEGWIVRVNKTLLTDERELGEQALRLLAVKLFDVERTIPTAAVEKLRRVPIWLGVDDGHAPCAEYHPSREWLSRNGYNPDKAKAVELGNARRFLEWSLSQPSMVLHELAHAYHDQVLGFDHSGVKQAYEKAKASGMYESVLHSNGRRGRAYALNTVQEYFAEATEAYFGTNDFYPFVRAELREHDPEIARILNEVWNPK